MDVIPKNRLEDKAYYEGFDHDHVSHVTARWNAERDIFEYLDNRWDGGMVIPMAHSDDDSEYFGVFSPLIVVEPKDSEKVENFV
jgi:hypothetical protein